MQKSNAPNAAFGEPDVSGADDVQKTTSLAGKGTDDRTNRHPEKPGDVASDADRVAPDRRGAEGT